MFVEINKNISDELPFIPISIGTSSSQVKVERPSGFDVHQFIWVTGGEGLFTSDGESRTLLTGQGFFSKKNIPHSYQKAGDIFSTMWVTFLSGEALLDYYGAGDAFFFDVPKFLADSANQLMDLCINTPSEAVRSAHGFSWAAELLDALFKKPMTKSEQVSWFLEHNFDRPLTLQMIADSVGTDRFNLCRTYAKETGKTVMQTLKNIRLQKAKNFLRYSTYSVEQIGLMCGFESSSYFIKIFREQLGITPLSYRQSKW